MEDSRSRRIAETPLLKSLKHMIRRAVRNHANDTDLARFLLREVVVAKRHLGVDADHRKVESLVFANIVDGMCDPSSGKSSARRFHANFTTMVNAMEMRSTQH